MDFYPRATKFPDRMTVRIAAATLIMVNKITTSLEVKDFLEHQGYHAEQKNISKLMVWAAEEEGWLYFYNGKFRVYMFGEEKDNETMIECDLLEFSSN